ncbi:MAG TPA: TetR/AcrR family transcriptional regulator [Luteitalea sp.]|nr:TetR/AcrR family transcriptional regulator [Luteitalea sp.]
MRVSPRATLTMDVREQLLEAALKVFAEAGFRGATTRRIAQEAGVNEVTLFRQFGSKEGLILEAVVRAVERLQDEDVLPQVPLDPESELLAWTQRHYDFLRQHSRLIKAAMAETQTHPDMACVGDRLGQNIKLNLRAYLTRLCAAGYCDADIDVEVAGNVLSGTVFADAMGRDVHPQCYPFSAEEAPRRYVAFLLRAIGARQAVPPENVSEAVAHHA